MSVKNYSTTYLLENPNLSLYYDPSIIQERKRFLEDLLIQYPIFQEIMEQNTALMKFKEDRLEINLSRKKIDSFNRFLIEEPSFVKYITFHSIRKYLTIGALKILLEKEPILLLDSLTKEYLGRSPFLHEISEFFAYKYQYEMDPQLGGTIETNLAQLLPAYSKFKPKSYNQMDIFKNFDASSFKITSLFDLLKVSQKSFEKLYRILLWSNYSRYTPYLYIKIPKKKRRKKRYFDTDC